MTQRPEPAVCAKAPFLYPPIIITPHCTHAVLCSDKEYPNTRVRSRERMIQVPKRTILFNLDQGRRPAHLVKSFNFSTINTLLGTLRRTSKTEMSNPSRLTTASLIASISSIVWGSMSIIPEARWKVLSECSSSHVPSNAARPVIAASNTGYWISSASG